MDRLKQQRQAIQQVMKEHVRIAERNRDRTPTETLAICDTQSDNYLLVVTGWQDRERAYGVLVHLRILDGKIHIEQNNVEDFVEDIIDLGIPESDFVLSEPMPATELAAAS